LAKTLTLAHLPSKLRSALLYAVAISLSRAAFSLEAATESDTQPARSAA